MEPIAVVFSRNRVPIKLTVKTWAHIVDEHDYMAGYLDQVLETVSEPEFIIEGKAGELISARFYRETHLGSKYLVVIYKEVSLNEGFVITAYMSSEVRFRRFASRRRRII